uniref:Kinetochore protein NDC80 n=1 Tax=Schistocephalus solidus TaxID=70667 RepID=A0A0X3PPI0_SCHSO
MSRRAFSSIPERRSYATTSAAPNIPPGTVRKTKPRQKSAVNEKIISLLEYLESTGYPEAVSSRTLQSPSSQLVMHIFEFIVRLTDPSFGIPSAKAAAEDCFLSTLRTLGYRGTMSKSLISTPGAMHAWPHILSALDWLRAESQAANEAMASQTVFSPHNRQVLSEPPLPKTVLEFFVKALREDPSGNIDPDSYIVKEFTASVEAAFGCSAGQIKSMEAEIKELEAEPTCDHLRAREESLRASIREAEAAASAARDEVDHLLVTMVDAEQVAKAASTRLAEVTSRKTAIQNTVDELEAVLASQNSKFGGLVQKHRSLVERCQQQQQRKQLLKDELQSFSIELARIEASIPPAVDKFNMLASTLANIPSAPKLPLLSYLSTFDPIKEVPVMCKNVREALKAFQASLTELEAKKAQALANVKKMEAAMDAKKSEVTRLKLRREKLSQSLTDTTNELASHKADLEKWVSETELAISEAKKTLQAKQAHCEVLAKDIEEYESGHKYYAELNRKAEESAAIAVRDTENFLKDLVVCYQFCLNS